MPGRAPQGDLAQPSAPAGQRQERCDPLGGEEKAACQARALGYGNTSGSVAGGGVLREVETVVLPPGQRSDGRTQDRRTGCPGAGALGEVQPQPQQ